MAILNNLYWLSRIFFRRWAWIGLICLILLPALSGAKAWSADFNPGQIRAAFIYNLANFVDWSAEDGRKDEHTFVIAVIGDDEILSNLKILLKDEHIKGKAMEVKRYASITDVSDCQILYVGASTTENMIHILKATTDNSTLTVGASDGFINLGGMVNLRYQKRRMKIEINLDAAQKVGINFNAKLLKLATIVNLNN